MSIHILLDEQKMIPLQKIYVWYLYITQDFISPGVGPLVCERFGIATKSNPISLASVIACMMGFKLWSLWV